MKLESGSVRSSHSYGFVRDTLCMPRSASGGTLKPEVVEQCCYHARLLWALAFEKDKLWVRWIGSYYYAYQKPRFVQLYYFMFNDLNSKESI